ncbi:hypothetical protein [Rhodococcus sp. NPDC127528]|uniref:hypothetical protein n=1 Tax=unclassified Rhodococcus (in: high G+C Gram-positive bacteria) TaxID=192944 RepID=UPI00363F8BB1
MPVVPGEQLARRVRCTSVGAVTVAVAVAAHGIAGGGLPTSSALLLLVGVAAVLSSATAAIPVLRRGAAPLVPVLGAGQVGAHLCLSVVGGHHHVPSPAGASGQLMIGTHLVAIAICAALIVAAERIGPRVDAALRAVAAALLARIPAVELPRTWLPVADRHPVLASVGRGTEPRRGPPVLV